MVQRILQALSDMESTHTDFMKNPSAYHWNLHVDAMHVWQDLCKGKTS